MPRFHGGMQGWRINRRTSNKYARAGAGRACSDCSSNGVGQLRIALRAKLPERPEAWQRLAARETGIAMAQYLQPVRGRARHIGAEDSSVQFVGMWARPGP